MTPLWHACDYYNTPIKVEDQTAFVYKSGFSFTKTVIPVQKWHFVYKYSVVVYIYCFSLYKVASYLTSKFLVQ
ncbi:Hypothetical protein CKL_2278 [Clostridium kluyveri DSM 555]|uniref:Uncharacterized protein n=1 Tax=Clostridium kluyveri (strain ATCC 8527 / DSM 555 / NBRC 12016 / NCIMB 10680 / K1) TaxID=431943 RepID=A5MZJ4_CLOK5|nr:Hypothetical protein CKL_2278 [Clostridium kluyveri DSM 555]